VCARFVGSCHSGSTQWPRVEVTENEDWILLADLLEYEFLPAVDKWKKVIAQLREDIHMHMVAYVTGVGVDATGPTGLYINPRRRGRVNADGLRCCISSWVRTSDNAIPIRLKSGPNYQNGRLATLQAKADGYDAAIFLNGHGHVAEGSGATFMMVRKGN